MTPTPPQSTGHSPQEASQHSAGSGAFRVIRKRNRVPLSCGPCRNRKLKCNRAQPCENCVRRGDSTSCTYATSHQSSARARKSSAGSSGSSDEMQSRIDRLEGLVLSLMSGNGNNVSPRDRDRSSSTEEGRPRSYGLAEEDDVDAMRSIHEEDGPHERSGDDMEDEVEEVRNALGIMKVYQGKSFYRGETHWAAILSEITEVKKFFEETKQKYEAQLHQMKCQSLTHNLEATGFPFSAGKPPTKQEILALVPRQELVDLLVDAYFRNYDPIFHVLHRPSFYQQYEDFWRDPSKCDTLWLGLLMVMMSIALKIYHHSGEEPKELCGKTLEMAHAFRIAAEQSLIVGGYTKKLYLHTVQCLILLCTAAANKDNTDGTWLFLGMVVRIAMSMGLHRDPGQFPQISYGEREIRRRLWTLINCIDLLYSVQLGLPAMVKQEECDTRLPSNLHDDEIGDSVHEMPPERGKNELTGVSYMIAKASMASVYWQIVRQVNCVGPRPPYEHVLKLDTEIRERYQDVPEFLKLKSKDESKNDPAWLIIQRYNLDLLQQKALVSLHRPYAARADENPRFMYSRRQCVDAAMTLLNHQAGILQEGETTLRHARWFTENLGSNDFLHAAMIVCLHLNRTCAKAHQAKSQGVPYQFGTFTRDEQYAALERAKEISQQQQASSVDAAKAYGVISLMLEKLHREDPGKNGALPTPADSEHTTETTSPDFSIPTGTSPDADPNDPVKTEQAAAMTLGMMSGGGLTPNSAATMLSLQPGTPGGSALMADVAAAAAAASSAGATAADAAATSSSSEALSSPPASAGTIGLGAVLTPPAAAGGWQGLWGNSNPWEVPNGLEWDEWDDFMQGINLDTSQMPGWPVMGGLSAGGYTGEFPPKRNQEQGGGDAGKSTGPG